MSLCTMNDETIFKRYFQGEFYFYKCKEYYLDCQTVVSYNVTNGCSKLDVFTYYTRFDSSFQKINKCPLYVSTLFRFKIYIITINYILCTALNIMQKRFSSMKSRKIKF